MDPKIWLIVGCLLAGLGVVVGAFGAHGLEGALQPGPDASQAERDLARRRIETFETAVRYQMYHAMGLIAVGLMAFHTRSSWLNVSAWFFIAGIVLFSGMLYGWVLFQYRPLAMIVPLGGMAFIVGWLALGAAAFAASHPPATGEPLPFSSGRPVPRTTAESRR